ncbi:MAG: putative membrane protein [uncultured Nocardioidaceae bacterium]|uniref:Putative membrane protein n=1 Tax=uncultured Nocardioidaceae bacterium TaxID=253824 RepID=A0A6J4MQP1_9ACTN|nr:MAG: putative membrane protein [uncultured Nocardioidaceae bacterium]
MDLLLLLLLIGGIFWLISSASRRSVGTGAPARRAVSAADLEAPRRAAEEDVTRFGEELQRLDLDVQMAGVDEAMLQDWQRALDSYESAKRSLELVQMPEDVRHVTTALEDGRYAVACVRARRDGQPLPVRRPPCFFNPSHGPSTTDVDWSPPGGQARRIPVCGADADRLAQGAEPDIRTVPQGAGRVPYWNAGPAYSPWAMGYFSMYAATGLLPAFMLGSLLATDWDGVPADGFDTGGDAGDGGFDGGDGGGDGGDFGGGDVSGGGDFGAGGFGDGGFGDFGDFGF